MSRATKPPADTVALTAFRELPDGRARQYTEACTRDNPWRGCEWFIRMWRDELGLTVLQCADGDF